MGLFTRDKQETPKVITELPLFLGKVVKQAAVEIPKPVESKVGTWVLNGKDNCFPKDLTKLKNESAVHSAIIENAARLTVGKGLMFGDTREQSDALIASMSTVDQVRLKQFLKTISTTETIDELMFKVIRDYKTFGYAFLEVIWNDTHTRPVQINYIDASRVALGRLNEDGDVDTFWYSNDWSNIKNNTPVSIEIFNPETEGDNQLIFFKNQASGMDYYGLPSYYAALNWVKCDSLVAKTNLNSIENGFSPNLLVRFFGEPSPEQKDSIVSEFKRALTGLGQKIMFLFWNGKDDAPEVTPLTIENFNERMVALNDLIVQQIISGHRCHPEIVGIAIPGKLGYGTGLKIQSVLYYNTVITPERKQFEAALNTLIKLNGFNVDVQFEDFNIDYSLK